MSSVQPKVEVVNGIPLEFEPAGLIRDRVTTVALTGSGTANIYAVHQDNDPILIVSGGTVPMMPQNIYGVGYTKIIVEQLTGSVFASITSARY